MLLTKISIQNEISIVSFDVTVILSLHDQRLRTEIVNVRPA